MGGLHPKALRIKTKFSQRRRNKYMERQIDR
jgi:hypothetical protein